jgi:hypothetical protein
MKPVCLMIGALVAASVLGSAATAEASLFVPGSSFTVSGTNSPDTFSNSVSLTPGTTSLDNGALQLTLSIVPDGSTEWLVFSYSTTSGGVLSQPGQFWQILQTGLQAAVPVNFIAAFDEYLNNGTAITPSSGIFPGASVMANPVPGGAGIGVGSNGFTDPVPAGPLGDLGAFLSPFGQLDGDGVPSGQVTGFLQALQFAPQQPQAVPEPMTLTLWATSLLGLGAIRRRRAKS